MRAIKFRVWFKPLQKMYTINGMTFDASTGDVYGVHFPVVYLAGRDDIELMQYTGLKDKNGKEVYEGDIVHDPLTGKRYPVVFENGAFRANGLVVCNAFPNDEVIGNIYENSELL